MKKPIITLIVCAALVVGGFFGAKAIVNRERIAHAEGMQAQGAQTEAPQIEDLHTRQPGKAEIIWYHPSDEHDRLDLTSLSDDEVDAIMNAQSDAIKASLAFDRAVENYLPEGMHYPDWFGGRWIAGDNKLHIAFARCADDEARALVERALSGYSSKVFYEEDMPYSYNELYRAIDDVAAHLREKGIKLTCYGVDTQFNCMNIGVITGYLDAAEALRAELEALFPYPMVFEEGEYFQAQ